VALHLPLLNVTTLELWSSCNDAVPRTCSHVCRRLHNLYTHMHVVSTVTAFNSAAARVLTREHCEISAASHAACTAEYRCFWPASFHYQLLLKQISLAVRWKGPM
jgi:hypothetical protein